MKLGPFKIGFREHMTVSHGKGYKTTEAEDKGRVITSYQADTSGAIRLPHSDAMDSFDEWGKDPEARVALEVLKNLIAGVGYYTEMPDEKNSEKTHPHQKTVDDYGEDVNLDEKLQTVVYRMLHKGFCPAEIIQSDVSERDIKVLPSETFYKYIDKKGNLLKYTQERSMGDVVSSWKGVDLESIVMFTFGPGPYGMGLLEPIGGLLTERDKMNRDMPKAIHRWAYPIPILETSGDKTSLQQACEDRDVDDWIFIGNADKDEVRTTTLAIDPQARFIPYIELIYYQICEGLHAPLLLYLKNATEASATVMMESVDRLVNGVQRYVKRRVEKFLFEPLVGEPVPRLVWGQPKTGLEDVTLTDLSQIMPFLAKNQQQHILKQYLGALPDPVWEKPEVPQPFGFGNQPPMKPPMQNIEKLVDRLNDVETNLSIISSNFEEGKLGVTEACRLADRTITVHMKRLHGDNYESFRDEMFQGFIRKRLLKVPKESYRVQIE